MVIAVIQVSKKTSASARCIYPTPQNAGTVQYILSHHVVTRAIDAIVVVSAHLPAALKQPLLMLH